MAGKYQNKQEKGKKPFYRRWWFWLIVVILLLGSCSTGLSDTTEESKPAAHTTEATPAPKEKPQSTTSANSNLDAAVGMIEVIVKENYKNYEIHNDDNMIIVNVWDDGIAFGSTLAAGGNEENKAAWDTLVKSQTDACNAMREFVDTVGLEDVTVMLNVLNDLDKDKTLLSIADGVVIYNAVSSN